MARQIITIEVHWNEQERQQAESQKGPGTHGAPGSWGFRKIFNYFLEHRSMVSRYITKVVVLQAGEVIQDAKDIQAEIEAAGKPPT